MKYFKNISTMEDLKKEYRKLALKFHPDNIENGNIETMQAINEEYEKLFNSLKAGSNKANSTSEKSTDFINIINALMKYEGLTIDIVGHWIWINKENTYDIKDTLKGLGFLWSSSRKKWYFNGSSKKQRVTYKQKSFKSLMHEYGHKSIKTNEKEEKIMIG